MKKWLSIKFGEYSGGGGEISFIALCLVRFYWVFCMPCSWILSVRRIDCFWLINIGCKTCGYWNILLFSCQYFSMEMVSLRILSSVIVDYCSNRPEQSVTFNLLMDFLIWGIVLILHRQPEHNVERHHILPIFHIRWSRNGLFFLCLWRAKQT